MQKKNIRICIKCDDEALPEYDVKEDDDGIPTCFIASEAGKVSETKLTFHITHYP